MSTKTPAFRKLLFSQSGANANTTNMLDVLSDQGACCEDNDKAVVEVSNSATDLTTSAVESIVIDGVTYTFAAAADTEAKLETGIRSAFESAGYAEVFGVAVSITGGDDAAVATISTTATVTKMVNAASADIAFS